METPQPPQGPVSERIVTEGQPLAASNGAGSDNDPTPPWWKFWRWKFWRDPAALAIGTIALALFSLFQIFVSRDQEKRQLRAYAFAEPTVIANFSTNSHPTTQVVFKNSGQTPAYHLTGSTGIYPSPYPLSVAIPSGTRETTTLETTLNPAAESHIGGSDTMQRPITPDEANAIRDGQTMRMYVYGAIHYDDAFGNSHYSNYCFSFWGDGPVLTHWTYCPQHNDAD